MPDNLFKQIALDILRLHQYSLHSLLAMQQGDEAQIHEAVYATFDGRYYVWLPENAKQAAATSILLIEAPNAKARLSWVANMRTISRKSGLYHRAIAALQRRMQYTKNTLSQAAGTLLELTPQQGRLTIEDGKDFALSQNDLLKALYPAAHRAQVA